MARIGGENSDQIDPLVDYSSLFLFPRCFTYHPNPNISSAGSVYSHLKSMVLRNPENLLKQAKTVIDDSLNLFKNDKTSALASEDKMDAVFVTNEKNPQVKRPALGLKQEKFSAKPMPGQPYTVTEPSIVISKLEDPLEFEAYERMENSKKEMKKLRGEPLNELDQNLSSLPPGSKRLSLMGKSATYRHQSYTSMATDDHNKTLLSSEEAFVNCSGSPVHWDVQSETDDVVMLPKTKVHDSSTSETWKDCDLHKLFSSDYDALDAADVLNLLHEKLDVKVQKFDSTSHLNGARKAIHGKLLATGSQSNESKVQLAKSPLASISMLNRRISKLSPSMDPFSVIDIDSSPDKSSSRRRNGQQGDARMEMYGSHRSFVHAEESSAVDRRVFSVNGITSSSQAEDQLAEVGQCGPDCSTEQLQDTRKSKVKINESNAGYDRESPLSVRKRGAANVGQFDGMERQEDSCEIVRSPERFNDRVADPCFDFVGFAARDGNPTYEDKETENEVLKDVDSVHRKLNIENFNIEKSTVNEVEGCELVEASITKGILSKEPAKKTRGPKKTLRGKKSKASSQASPANETVDKEMEANTLSNPVLQPDPPKKRRKQIGDAPAARKKNEHRRTNLYGDMAGTEWDAGVRRSTRIRMRPLEYWKGERFIYGRVEDSLVTVIGVKYASPSKEAEQPRIKVKSFL